MFILLLLMMVVVVQLLMKWFVGMSNPTRSNNKNKARTKRKKTMAFYGLQDCKKGEE